MNLRAADLGDLETVFGIQRSASLAALAHVFPPDRYPFPDEPLRGLWREALVAPEQEIIVAEEEGRAVGVVSFAQERLDRLFVVPEGWGRGIGGRLHDEAVSRLRAQGCTVCRLWVLEENRGARRFYERRGWRADGRTRATPFPPHPNTLGYTLELG